MSAGNFAAIAITLYTAHHVGDYWVQRDSDARHKGDPGRAGRLHCLSHVLSYVITQLAWLTALTFAVGQTASYRGTLAGLLISGVTHYLADRRTPLIRLVNALPWKRDFLEVGAPRGPVVKAYEPIAGSLPIQVPLDNPQLATGLWALDQSWHIFWGVFVAALVMVVVP